jgi:anti-anti-sigma factor
MKLSATTIGPVTVVRMEGNLDSESSPPVHDELARLIDEGASRLLVNLEGVGFVSSAGLRIIVSALKKLMDCGGELRLSNLNDPVTQVFEISGLISVLKVFATEEEALQGF